MKTDSRLAGEARSSLLHNDLFKLKFKLKNALSTTTPSSGSELCGQGYRIGVAQYSV